MGGGLGTGVFTGCCGNGCGATGGGGAGAGGEAGGAGAGAGVFTGCCAGCCGTGCGSGGNGGGGGVVTAGGGVRSTGGGGGGGRTEDATGTGGAGTVACGGSGGGVTVGATPGGAVSSGTPGIGGAEVTGVSVTSGGGTATVLSRKWFRAMRADRTTMAMMTAPIAASRAARSVRAGSQYRRTTGGGGKGLNGVRWIALAGKSPLSAASTPSTGGSGSRCPGPDSGSGRTPGKYWVITMPRSVGARFFSLNMRRETAGGRGFTRPPAGALPLRRPAPCCPPPRGPRRGAGRGWSCRSRWPSSRSPPTRSPGAR